MAFHPRLQPVEGSGNLLSWVAACELAQLDPQEPAVSNILEIAKAHLVGQLLDAEMKIGLFSSESTGMLMVVSAVDGVRRSSVQVGQWLLVRLQKSFAIAKIQVNNIRIEPFFGYHAELMGWTQLPLSPGQIQAQNEKDEEDLMYELDTADTSIETGRSFPEIRADFAQKIQRREAALAIIPEPQVVWINQPPPYIEMVTERILSEKHKLKWCLLRARMPEMETAPSSTAHFAIFYEIYAQLSNRQGDDKRLHAGIQCWTRHVEQVTGMPMDIMPAAIKSLITQSTNTLVTLKCAGCPRKMPATHLTPYFNPELLWVSIASPEGRFCSPQCAAGRCGGCLASLDANLRCGEGCGYQRGDLGRTMTKREYVDILLEHASPKQAENLRKEIDEQDSKDRQDARVRREKKFVLSNDKPMKSFAPNYAGYFELLPDPFWGV